MCAHRTAQCVAGYVSTQRHCGATSGSSHQTQSTGPVPMDVDQTRGVSGFSSGKDGKGKSNAPGEQARLVKTVNIRVLGGSSPWTRPSAPGCGDTLKAFESDGSI